MAIRHLTIEVTHPDTLSEEELLFAVSTEILQPARRYIEEHSQLKLGTWELCNPRKCEKFKLKRRH